MNDYKVTLDVYNGPLDLLLYLIRRDEVDIYDIPIARITEQYCHYCETLSRLDPDLAGEFLVLAATLMEIKSRTLLPRPPAEQDDAPDLSDPRTELVRQLLEYKRFKDASHEMADAAALHAQRWPRGAPRRADAEPGAVDLDDVEIWDLVAAFGQLLAATGRGPATHEVIFDDTPIQLHAADIIDRLSREGSMSLRDIFVGRNRGEMIGLFLALLELVRESRVCATQPDPHGPIQLILLSAEPIAVGEEWDRPADAGRDDPGPPESPRADVEEGSSGQLHVVHAEAEPDEADADDAFPELDAIRVDTDVVLEDAAPPPRRSQAHVDDGEAD